MKNLLLLLFGLLFYPTFSQVQLKGNITDAESGETIPYANVYLKNQPIGTTAFRDGSFSLKLDSVFRDSVVFSIIGYKPKSLFLPDAIKTKVVAIKLEPTQEELKEVEVMPRKLESYKVGLVRHRATTTNGTLPERPDARFISNECQVNGYIKNISVYVSKKGIPEAPFRLNLLRVDKVSGSPGVPLVNQDFILNAEEGNEWVKLNLEKRLIMLPEQGFFVIVQSLPIDSMQLQAYKERLPDFKEGIVKMSAPLFGYAFEAYSEAADANWCFHCWNDLRWTPYWRKNYLRLDSVRSGITSGRASSLIIKAEINYYADQKLKVKDLKTKRAVKKIFDRPDENTLKYPQSTPSYLLSSLKQAFEANDLAYACSYLLYYDDKDELEETMAFLESMKDTLGEARLTEKEIENVTVLLSSLEAELQNLKPADGKRFIFGLKLKDELFYFQNKDGAWKINPRSTSLLQNREIKISARF
ncbi:carboxypeptidase-like regulatory domain-containing protein [Owenweeksia hongkongensis]|uniref:carboxypeptidase-like regulatory domain-containing protein n=1 Tax=Owenweeksia hongkongensis TaxID=253245 RepID=UPI003A93475C